MNLSSVMSFIGEHPLVKPALLTAAVAAGAARLLFLALQRRRRASLRDKVVLITGASSGLGRALATRFHSMGSRLILCARSLDKLAQLSSELSAGNTPNTHDPIYRYLDLSDENGYEGLVREAAEDCDGRIDVLVNNAGMSVRASCDSTFLSVHRRLMEVNYFGQIRMTQAVLPYLKQSAGQVLVISSVQDRLSIPYRSAYSASKHAVLAYFDCLRAELAEEGVGVLVVSPGYIKTDLSRNAVTGSGEKYGEVDASTKGGMSPDVLAERIVDALVRRESEMVAVGFKPRVAMFLRYLFPSIYFWLMGKRALKEKQKAN